MGPTPRLMQEFMNTVEQSPQGLPNRRTWLLSELQNATLEILEELTSTSVREMIDVDAFYTSHLTEITSMI